MPARGTRATGKSPDHRFPGGEHAIELERLDSRLCATAPGAWLGRGRTVKIEYRWAEGRSERYAEIAAEFIQLKADVIITVGSPAMALKQATSTIPVVFALASDPVGSGLVASLARPGGNLTGLSIQSRDLAGKRIELLREIVPGLRRLAIIGNVGITSGASLEIDAAQAAARALSLDTDVLEIRRAEDIPPRFAAINKGIQALRGAPTLW